MATKQMKGYKEIMTNHELNNLKSQIDSKINYIIKELNLKKEDDKYYVTEEDFKKLKLNLHFELNTHRQDLTYDYHYHMDPVSNFTLSEYNIILNITKDYEFVAKYILPFTIVVKQKDTIDYNEVKDISLYELLYNTPNQDELINFQNELFEYEVNCTLDEGWLEIRDSLREKEQQYYELLTESEKVVFAKAHSYTYVTDLLYTPIRNLFDIYDIEFINTLFNKIKFVK